MNIPPTHHIFPLRPGSKRPVTGSAGFKDALPAAEAIKKWPTISNGNIGLHPGPSGLLVIDVDVKNGATGEKTLVVLEAIHGKLPETYTVTTPSGGRHLYFQKPPIDHIGNINIGKDIDIRCDAGYVVMPGGVVEGKQYVVANPAPVSPLPDSWLALFQTPPKSPSPTHAGFPTVDQAEVKAALDKIPADLPYNDWIKVLASLHSEGLEEIAHTWSAKDPRYERSQVEKIWSGFDVNKIDGVSIRTLFYLADQYSPWADPEPLPTALGPVKTFNPDLLPAVLNAFINDIANRMQCPPDFPAVSLLVSLATLIGRRCGIYPKRQDDWLVVPNLWGMIVGRPALMKSPSLQEAMKPLDKLIDQFEKAHAINLELAEIKEETYAGTKKAWKEMVRKAAADGKKTDDMLPPEKPVEPVKHRFRTNAGSVECLIGLLNDNPDGLLVFRDELTGWLKTLEKSGKEGDRQFFLEAWNGSGSSFDYDTFAHGQLHSAGLCLSILGTMQPGPLSQLVASAVSGAGGDDGMIQRFQLMVYPDASSWTNVDRAPDMAARNRVTSINVGP